MAGPDYYAPPYYGVCGEFGWVRFLVVYFLYKTNPNPPKIICCRKKWPKRHFLTNFFLGLGWPWVGEFVGFTMIRFRYFPTQHNLVYRKSPYFGFPHKINAGADVYPLGLINF